MNSSPPSVIALLGRCENVDSTVCVCGFFFRILPDYTHVPFPELSSALSLSPALCGGSGEIPYPSPCPGRLGCSPRWRCRTHKTSVRLLIMRKTQAPPHKISSPVTPELIPSYKVLSVVISVCLPFGLGGIRNSYYHSVSNSVPLAKIAVSLF